MGNNKNPIGFNDILLIAINVLILIGINSFCKPCDIGNDGKWMMCHWAGNMIFAISLVCLILSIAHVALSNSYIKLGIDISLIPFAVLILIIPNGLINLCMMESMRCHMIMAPCVTVFSILLLLFSMIDFFVIVKKLKKSYFSITDEKAEQNE